MAAATKPMTTSSTLPAMSPTTAPCAIDLAGETLILLPERAAWWPAARCLFVADLHLGKAASYRALGQPVPGGSTEQNLARLDGLIHRLAPHRLVFLGDFLHAAQGRTPALLAAVDAWRARWPDLPCTLVRGNHDSRAGDPPAALHIDVVDEPHLLGPFAACHHPQAHATHCVLAGHVHPTIRLHGRGRDSLRLPCFVRDGEQRLILPAFGEFTGGWLVERVPGSRFYAVGAEAVWTVPG